MLRIVFLVFAVLVLASVAFALIVSALAILAVMCLVGIPLWLLAKPRLQRAGIAVGTPRLTPVERLQALYAEGKIDMFEFERRVSRLISIES
jgi:hypothetical protein